MAGKFGPRRDCAKIGQDGSVAAFDIVRNRTECLIQLLSAFHDIADFDDIHQAAQRLDTVQAWIRREARAAAADLVFDGETNADFRIKQVTAA
jgi:hypothetical protein